MLRLLSTMVLVLLVCKGEAEIQQLRQDPQNKCALIAGDLEARKDKTLEHKTIIERKKVTEDIELYIRARPFVKGFSYVITFIEVLDTNCDPKSTKPISKKDFASIKSDGIGKKDVKLKFNSKGMDEYVFAVTVRGIPV